MSEQLPNRFSFDAADLRETFRGRRFLIVIGTFASFGGAERQALILGNYLACEIGADVSFLASVGGPLITGMLDKQQLPWYVQSFPERTTRAKRALNLIRLTLRLRRDIKPEFIIPFIGYNSKVMAQVYRPAGAKYTLWNQRDEGRGLYGSRGEWRALRKVCDVVSNSYEGRDFLCRTYGLSERNVHVINNGIAVPEPRQPTWHWHERMGLEKDVLIVTMLANLTKFKDHHTLLNAWQIVHREINAKGTRAVLLLAGREGDTTKNLKVQAFDLRLGDSLYFLGRVDDTNALLAETDLVVHSSVCEGCPNAVLEGMALGNPVVGTDISGMRQALGEEMATECLVPPHNADALAGQILCLLNDPQRRAFLGKKNLEYIETAFSIEGMACAYLNLVKATLIS